MEVYWAHYKNKRIYRRKSTQLYPELKEKFDDLWGPGEDAQRDSQKKRANTNKNKADMMISEAERELQKPCTPDGGKRIDLVSKINLLVSELKFDRCEDGYRLQQSTWKQSDNFSEVIIVTVA